VTGSVLDTGALIAIDRGQRTAVRMARLALEHETPLVVPAGCLAQAWRDPRHQARLSRFLRGAHVTVAPLDRDAATLVGALLRQSGTSDVIDAHVAVEARRRRCVIVTGDARDLRALDPGATIVEV
jgi:hypothetical protein